VSSGLGAVLLPGGRTLFRVWAPSAETLEVEITQPDARTYPLVRDARGYHEALIEDIGAGARYYLRFPDGQRLPDPASRYQPEGVHGPSEIVSPHFDWTDTEWQVPDLPDFVIYELHVGAFTPEGTFDGVIPRLPYLRELGVNALELMPVAQFPGTRNWGYDGVFPFAVQNSYGGPAAFKRLVNACHEEGLAVILDVVFNHLGPEGNILGRFGPYFNARYRTPWGDALNFDGPGSDDVRRFFLEALRRWVNEFHVDALRIDAVHAILDTSANPFLTELAEAIHADAEQQDRNTFLIAESDLNDPRMIRPRAQGGHGMDAQWLDDFHHALHTLITSERRGYYADYGELEQLARSYREGFVYTGQYSTARKRRHGASASEEPFHRFVTFAQNHDQVGNRLIGDRLSALVSVEAQKLAAGALLGSPFVPLLFMGEEYGELAPFPYFVDHSLAALLSAVNTGRAAEFVDSAWAGSPPDPGAESTFFSAQLSPHLAQRSPHRELLAYYQEWLALRRKYRLAHTERSSVEVLCLRDEDVIVVLRRPHTPANVALVLSFAPHERTVSLPLPSGQWSVLLDSADSRWAGPGSSFARTFVVRQQADVTLAPWSALLLLQNAAA
jgi:maltooligosyltrehalose trehalohydrolase